MTDKKNNGGYVYPKDGYPAMYGLTLRQYYAGLALQGLLASPGIVHTGKSSEDYAIESFIFADSMIEQGDK